MKLDIKKILAERNERTQRELELNGGASESNDSFPATPVLENTSLLFESSSQSNVEKKSDSLVILNIFDPTQVFHLFKETDVNFSWLEKDARIEDVPTMSPSELIGYLQTTLKAKYCRRSHSYSILACRYMFFLMATTTDNDVMITCLKLLEDQIADVNEPFCIQVSDLLITLMNYGSLYSKLWPEELSVTFPPTFNDALNANYKLGVKNDLPFPRSNLEKILKLLCYNLTTYPCYSESEKAGLLYLMLNLLMANNIVGDIFLVLLIKDVISALLESFSDEEWNEFDFKRVEELILQSWNSELDATGIVQRIELIPTTTCRGIQLQQSAAYFAIQNLMDYEEVTVCGRVLIDDVYQVLTQLNRPTSDFQKLFCIVSLLSYIVDLNDLVNNKDQAKELVRAINIARHQIRDVTIEMDANRFAVKELMCELSVLWKDSLPNDNVV